MNERDFSRKVIKQARDAGWIVAHFHRNMSPKGAWSTPVAADGKGFPDLVLVRERVMFVELKAKGKYPSPEQRQWIERLVGAGAEVHVWHPRDWEHGVIEGLLTEWVRAA
jgi:VRR-NUC domain